MPYSGPDKVLLYHPVEVLYVDKGDFLALFAGMAIVMFVAVLANPNSLTDLLPSHDTSLKPSETSSPPLISFPFIPPYVQTTVTPSATPKPDTPPYRIFLTDRPFTYPVYKLPENLVTTGASETPRLTQEWVPFALIENTRGGLTEVFSVPYPVWVINTTVFAEYQPQYANFRMVLCNAESGAIIKGEEIVSRGTSYRIVRTVNTSMYMIIGIKDIDKYLIRLETPREYYEVYKGT
jgi:hypothetical protein